MKPTSCISYLGQMEKAEGSFPQLRTVKEKQEKKDKVSVVVQWLSITQVFRKRGERWSFELQGNKEWLSYWDLGLRQRAALVEAKAERK